MMNTRIIRRLLFLVLALALFAVPAAADMQLAQGQVDLYAEGKLPPAPPVSPVSTKAATIESVIIDGLMAQSDYIDVSDFGLTLQEFVTIYQNLLNNSPDLFFVAGRFSYYYSGDYVMALVPEYKYSGAELDSRIAAYNATVNAIVADAKKASTAVGQMLRANEYFCLNYEYDQSYSIYSPELLFSEKTGVCQAYMLGYKAVLDRLGITSTAVPSDPLNHIWNLVNLGGSWYHIDVTWNDPLVNSADVPLGAFHEHFLRSDSGIVSTGHTSWNTIPYSATSTKYDRAFWIDLAVPLTVLGSKVYYNTMNTSTYKATLRSYDLSSSSVTNYYTYSPGGYSSWGVPACANDYRIYFPINHEVYSVDMSGANLRLEYTHGDTSKSILRMVMNDNELTMFLSSSSATVGEIITVELDAPLSMTINPANITMFPGETAALPIALSPAPSEMPVFAYASSRPQIVSIDAAGMLTAIAPGTATIMAAYNTDIFATATVTVTCDQTLVLPENTVEIRDGAFLAVPAQQAILPDGVASIGSGAFSGSDTLLFVNLPDNLAAIAGDAFEGSDNVTLILNAGTAAHEAVKTLGTAYIALEPETVLTVEDVLAALAAAQAENAQEETVQTEEAAL